jgi:hypothetical protein
VSALKHGLFHAAFMLCDRCAANANCESFTPKSRCQIELDVFEKIVAGLTEEFEMDSLADKILVERAAMYLVRIMRAEAYDASVGITEKTAFWGYYITKLDKMLRGLFDDLAISRRKRKQLDKGEALLVSIDEVIKKFNQNTTEPSNSALRQDTVAHMRRTICVKWRREYPKLASTLRRRTESAK